MLKKICFAFVCAILFSFIGCYSNTNIDEVAWSNSAQCVRIYRVGYDASPISDAVIHSTSELKDYYEQNKSQYDLESRPTITSDSTIGFLDACEKYDEDFFASRNLLILYLAEPSGSIRHEVVDVNRDENNNWKISVRKAIPEVGTDDIAEWLLLVEVDDELNSIDTVTLDMSV